MPEKSIVSFGDLTYAKGPTALSTLKAVRCQIVCDLHDTSNLTADLFASGEGITWFTAVELANSGGMKFEATDGTAIGWHGMFGGSSIGGHTDRFAGALIRELYIQTRRDVEEAERYKFIYYISDTELFRRRNPPARDSRHGLLYNWSWTKKKFKEEEYPFALKDWKITFKPTVRIEEAGEEKFILQDALIAVVEIEGGKYPEREAQARTVINAFLQAVTVFECRTVAWKSCEIVGYIGKNKSPSIDTEVYVHQYPQECDVDDNVFVDALLYHQELASAAEQWHKRTDAENEALQGIVQPYLDSNRPMIGLDLRIVRLHTAIEALVHFLKLPDKGTASQRWLSVLETLKIDWQKYYPAMKREEIVKKKGSKNFLLTDWRNQIVHQGALPETIPPFRVIKELRRVQKVVRKCIAAILSYSDPEIPERPMPTMTVTSKDGEVIKFGASE